MIYKYAKWTYNVHIYITQNIGISKHEKHFRLLCSGTKLFITFEFKRLFDIRRERHNLSILAFSSAHPPTRVAPATKVSASKRKPTVFFRGRTQLSNWLFQNLPKSCARFRCMTSFTLASLRFPSWAIVTSLNDTSVPPACARTPVLVLHLSNPCTEPKGSSA